MSTDKPKSLGEALGLKKTRQPSSEVVDPEPTPWTKSKDNRYLIQWQFGRLVCNCNDFKYVQSRKEDGTCKHIKELADSDSLPPMPEDGGTPTVVHRKSLGQALKEATITENDLRSETDDSEPLYPTSPSEVFPIELSKLLRDVDIVKIYMKRRVFSKDRETRRGSTREILVMRTITPADDGSFSTFEQLVDPNGQPKGGPGNQQAIPGSFIVESRRFTGKGVQYVVRSARLWTSEDNAIFSYMGTEVDQGEFLAGLESRLQP